VANQQRKSFKLGLGTRIYLSMIALVLISLIVIGSVTLYYFKNQNDDYHLERLQQKEQSVMLSLDYFIIENGINELNVRLENKIQELADIHQLDLSIYTTDGELMGSTHTELFDNGTFSKTIVDSTLQKIKRSEQIIIQESALDRTYLSTYFVLYASDRQPMAIVNLPYYKDEQRNKKEVFDFLGTLAQVYVGLFIGAALLAFFLSSYITNSLKAISEKLKAFRINGKNEKLEWESNDELSELVKDYNRMVDELEASAQLLAKSERESAWKEMAKQVAHEIKNPLTPMRLQIQHLQRLASENSAELPERIRKTSQTLIEQIDSLSRIATEFSNFAKMPKPTLVEVDVDEVLISVINLYQHEEVDIQLKGATGGKIVMADKEQLNRVFGNLIKNGIQAIPTGKYGMIEVESIQMDDNIWVRIADNGSGISEEQQSHIFEPNFTTKSGGMGLGLAIVQRIVESFDGKISFISEPNMGTTFSVVLPRKKHESSN